MPQTTLALKSVVSSVARGEAIAPPIGMSTKMQKVDQNYVFNTFETILSRGGVEDTRLEAKAKDTKKIRGQGQGQGQPFRGQTPRGQGQGPRTQSASALQKKKKKRSSQKFFRRSPKIFQTIST